MNVLHRNQWGRVSFFFFFLFLSVSRRQYSFFEMIQQASFFFFFTSNIHSAANVLVFYSFVCCFLFCKHKLAFERKSQHNVNECGYKKALINIDLNIYNKSICLWYVCSAFFLENACLLALCQWKRFFSSFYSLFQSLFFTRFNKWIFNWMALQTLEHLNEREKKIWKKFRFWIINEIFLYICVNILQTDSKERFVATKCHWRL